MPPQKYTLKGIAGKLVFDQTGKFQFEEKGEKEYQDLLSLDAEKINTALGQVRERAKIEEFYEKNLAWTKKDIRNSSSPDVLIGKALASYDELEKVINSLATRLRNWYMVYNPEFTHSLQHTKKFIELMLSKDKKQLLKEIGVKESMGFELKDDDVEAMRTLGRTVLQLISEQEAIEEHMRKKMKEFVPNLLEVGGVAIGARLLAHAGTLRHLMEMPASKIQLLGAEKALFRHLVSGSRCPKHGFIFSHPAIAGVPYRYHGKAARALADKLSLAAKIDFFKGEFRGKQLREELDKKIQTFRK